MKSSTKLVPFALMTALFMSSVSHASQYHFRYPIDGARASTGSYVPPSDPGDTSDPVEPSTPEDGLDITWVEFAESYEPSPLFYPDGWNTINWSEQGLTDYPRQDYPNDNPSSINFNDNNLTKLHGFNNIQSLGYRSLYAKNNQITEISGFNGLLNVPDWANASNFIETSSSSSPFHNNPIRVVSGFNGVETQSSTLGLRRNPELEAITGFQSLREVGGSLNLDGNPNLTDISGLSSLESVGSLDLRNTPIGGDFDTHFPNLTSVGGSLNLNNTGITSITMDILDDSLSQIQLNDNNLTELAGFNNIQSLGYRSLYAKNNQITEISGFNGLLNVPDWANASNFIETSSSSSPFHNNPIRVVSGFNGVETQSSTLGLRRNPELEAITGFQSLREVGGSLNLDDNPNLTDISGLSSLESVGGGLDLSNSPIGGDFDTWLPNLTSVRGTLNLNNTGITSITKDDLDDGLNYIYLNDNNLTELAGFNSIQYLDSRYTGLLAQNNQITEISGFNGLERLPRGSDLIRQSHRDSPFYNNPIRVVSGFNGVETQSSGLGLYGNPELEAITGFQSLREVGSSLNLSNNPNLTDISGLSSLESVGGGLDLRGSQVYDLSPLNNITHIGGSVGIPYGDSPVPRLDHQKLAADSYICNLPADRFMSGYGKVGICGNYTIN